MDIALWSGLEINLAIICGSVPALKAFVMHIVLGKHGSEGSGRYAYGTHSATRKHSHILRSVGGDEDLSQNDAKRFNITVRQSFEMRRFDQGSDEGSEKDLILAPKSAYSLPGQATITGQARSGANMSVSVP